MQKFLPIVYLNVSKMPGIVYFPGLSPFAHTLKNKSQNARNTNWVSDRGRPYAEEKVIVRMIGFPGDSDSKALAGTWRELEGLSRHLVSRGIDLVTVKLNVSERRGVLGLLLRGKLQPLPEPASSFPFAGHVYGAIPGLIVDYAK